jgi:very-short-patch-repair endonuclease
VRTIPGRLLDVPSAQSRSTPGSPERRIPSSPRTGPTGAGTTTATVARRDWDAAVADLARRQHGVAGRRQLVEMGLTADAIRHRVRSGRLHAVHPGVYAVGHVLLAPRGWWMAAVLANGEGALLSHRAAAALWGLVDGAPERIDVLTFRGATRRPGVRARRARPVPPEDRAIRDGIPCTAVARTLVDLAGVVDARTLDRAVRRAVDLRLFDRAAVEAACAPGRPGTRALRAAVAAVARDEAAGRRTKGELELRFLDLLRRHRFVEPSTNVQVPTPWGEYEIDAFWPAARLAIELDGWDTHNDRETFRRDHRRAADVSAAGHRVIRLTWEQVVDRPDETVARLARLVPRLPG